MRCGPNSLGLGDGEVKGGRFAAKHGLGRDRVQCKDDINIYCEEEEEEPYLSTGTLSC